MQSKVRTTSAAYNEVLVLHKWQNVNNSGTFLQLGYDIITIILGKQYGTGFAHAYLNYTNLMSTENL